MNNKLREDLENDGLSKEYIDTKIKKTRDNFLKAPFLILLCLDKNDINTYPDEERTFNEYGSMDAGTADDTEREAAILAAMEKVTENILNNTLGYW